MPVSDLSSVVASFYTGTYDVTRASGPGSYDAEGGFVPASMSVVQIQAVVAPLDGRELQRLPEGLRTRELRQVFTVAALRVAAPGQRPDVISIEGSTWQVEKLEDWVANGNFYRAIVSKEPP